MSTATHKKEVTILTLPVSVAWRSQLIPDYLSMT